VNFIEEMTNEELIKELERIINRIHCYSGSGEIPYKEKLKMEILNRLNA
jgi:hypothetical protein